MSLPRTLFGYIGRQSDRHQAVLALLSVFVFALTTIPLELQRRIVNDAVHGGTFGPLLALSLTYIMVALGEGLIKLALNIYRGWVSETAVRHLRRAALDAASPRGDEGVELSMVLSEVEPIGGFIGAAVSEPLLQSGILVSVFVYLLYLEPLLAGLSFLVFAPQLVFVPLLQSAINRRVERRVLTMREVSEGIVREGGRRSAASLAQQSRIDRVFALHMGMYQLKFSMNFLMNLTHHIGVAAALAGGGWFVVQGRIEIGSVVAFISGLAKLNDPWGDLVNWFRDMTVNRVKYRLAREAIERMRALTRVNTLVTEQPRVVA
ncbi:MAG: ABC transporter ATP-binding protein [Betaproteobacteria bacterium]|nr:ABC transporter ATP-binding protein [Betaproteobacteria bacterium]